MAAAPSLQCWFQLAGVKHFQEGVREGPPGFPGRAARAAATEIKEMSGGGDAQLRRSQRCTTGSQEFLLCLFSPHCSQTSLASFSGSSIWFLSAPYQEPDLNQWFYTY